MNEFSQSHLPERGDLTDLIFDRLSFGEPIPLRSREQIGQIIRFAEETAAHDVFREGLARRLNELGADVQPDDAPRLRKEVRRRFREKLGIECPRAVLNWCGGSTPGITARQNNYCLCMALENDLRQTRDFFIKHFLTQPFDLRNSTDAVFFYCLKNNKSYAVAAALLDGVKDAEPRSCTDTLTSQLYHDISEINDDGEFAAYLAGHCYSPTMQHTAARALIKEKLAAIKQDIAAEVTDGRTAKSDLNSLTLQMLFNYSYQKDRGKNSRKESLPERFTASLPNDVSFGKILNDGLASYETLRKTLMLVIFYDFFRSRDLVTEEDIYADILDFREELNAALIRCAFAPLYELHPFDCLLLACANSYDPIDTFHSLMNNDRDN